MTKTSWKHHYLAEKMNRESLEERLETERRIHKQKQIEFLEEVLKEVKNHKGLNWGAWDIIEMKLEQRIKELRNEASE